MTVLIQRNKK